MNYLETALEKTIAAIIVLLLALMMWGLWYENSVDLPNAYQAWVKQTGNPNHLTYEEWNSLRRSQKDNTIIFMPTR